MDENQHNGTIVAEIWAQQCLVWKWCIAARRERGETVAAPKPAVSEISIANSFKIYCKRACWFRKGMDGLAAIVVNEFDLDPFDGAIFVFRSKRADRLKIIVWDGTGLVLVPKRIEGL